MIGSACGTPETWEEAYRCDRQGSSNGARAPRLMQTKSFMGNLKLPNEKVLELNLAGEILSIRAQTLPLPSPLELHSCGKAKGALGC